MSKPQQNFQSALSKVFLLTLSEWNILLLISEGMNSKMIAIRVNLMPKSIDNYKNRIGKKLGLTGYGKLIAFAVKNKSYLKKNFTLLQNFDNDLTAVNSTQGRLQWSKVLLAIAEQK